MRIIQRPNISQYFLILVAIAFLGLFLLLPLGVIFVEAFSKGIKVYFAALREPDAMSALRLTLLAAAFAVTFNLVFGIATAWVVTKFNFRGKSLLLSLIDIPLAVSPVIAGMAFVLLYGSRGVLAPWVNSLGLKIIFFPPGILLATTFVTAPFIARELIPLMIEQGRTEEEAALTLGA
ncbi:MAG: sulfate ABC transporter permease subunit CysW, partial [SAR324 cluster bacterium]|nr:sulfate ABC transporter permease subunit CysW [SAR324 cluster bacterium]